MKRAFTLQITSAQGAETGPVVRLLQEQLSARGALVEVLGPNAIRLQVDDPCATPTVARDGDRGVLLPGTPTADEAFQGADVVIGTVGTSPDGSAAEILRFLEAHDYLPRTPEPDGAYSAEEEAMVRQHLEDLGYL